MWIKKMWHIYTMEYHSATKRNEIGSFVDTWMGQETVKHSEVSQKEKNKYHILTHICGIQQNGIDGLICKMENRGTDVEKKHKDIKWGGDQLEDWD